MKEDKINEISQTTEHSLNMTSIKVTISSGSIDSSEFLEDDCEEETCGYLHD